MGLLSNSSLQIRSLKWAWTNPNENSTSMRYFYMHINYNCLKKKFPNIPKYEDHIQIWLRTNCSNAPITTKYDTIRSDTQVQHYQVHVTLSFEHITIWKQQQSIIKKSKQKKESQTVSVVYYSLKIRISIEDYTQTVFSEIPIANSGLACVVTTNRRVTSATREQRLCCDSLMKLILTDKEK